MSRLLLALLVLACVAPARAADPAVEAATKAAQAIAAATLAGEFDKVIDLTYEPIVTAMGGRDVAVKVSKSAFDQMKAAGMSITALDLGQAGEVMTEGDKSFVVIPTKLQMRMPKQRITSGSYLLGISVDAGKTWKFIEGSGLASAEIREKVLPKLPAALKLPESKAPEVLKD